MKVYPFGYAVPGSMAILEHLMSDESMLIVDTRYIPASRYLSEYNKSALKNKYGARYRWAGQFLGNINYKGGLIQLAHPDTGITGLLRYLSEGWNVILLCACSNYEKCHRKVIVDLLQEQLPHLEVIQPEIIVPQDTIKCISVRQPYASWLVHPERFTDSNLPSKTIENREWNTSFRGRLLIHASKAFEKEAIDYWWGHLPGIERAVPMNEDEYVRGAIVGFADLIDVVTESDDQWFCGRYGWILADAHSFEKPIPYRGQLRLFDVPLSVIPEMLEMK